MEGITLNSQKELIKFERFTEKKFMKKDIFIVSIFVLSFIIVGLFEKNLFLPNSSLGLFQHINIWFFLATNCIIPIILSRILRQIEKTIDQTMWINFKDIFSKNAKLKSSIIMFNFIIISGFCCFIGNSLQNANLINHLPFDYWDSINYSISYVVSRIYKFYLFAYFIPSVLIYVYLLIKSLSEILVISDIEMEEYPLKKYAQYAELCNWGLNLLLTMSVPFILLSIGVFFVHGGLDIVSTTSILISVTCSLVFLVMYILLIKNFHTSIVKYKNQKINQLNLELAKIHQYIFCLQCDEKNNRQLDMYLKKERYLSKIKNRVEQLSKYPAITKAIFTSISPFIPTFLKIVFQLLKAFSNFDIFATIL